MNESNRRVSIAISAALFLITIAAFLRPPLLPDMGRDLDLTAIGLGALGSVFALGRLLADVPAGRLSDRIPPGRMMSMAAAMVFVGCVILALAPTSTLAFVSMLVLGAGSTWTLTTAQAFYATAPRSSRGAAMSVFAGSLLTAQAVGPVVGGALGTAFDWRVAIGAGALVSAIAVVPFFRVTGTVAPHRASPAAAHGGNDDARPLVLGLIYLLPAVQFSIGAAMVQTLVPIVADSDLGISAGIVGTALGVGGIARLIAALVTGRIMDTIGRRAAMVPGLALQVAGVAIFAFWEGPVGWWISIVLVSFGSIAVNVGTTLLADLSEGGRLGPRLGAFRFTGDGAFLVAPLLAGWLLDRSGRMVATLPLLALTTFVAVGCLIVIPETHRVE